MLAPLLEGNEFDMTLWDHPEEFVWFVGGWGPSRDRYIANAIRKLRALLRPSYASYFQEFSTLDIRFNVPEHFQDRVKSQDENGGFPWGDYPWGGGVVVTMGKELTLIGAVSCLTEIQDDTVTRLILGGIGEQIVQGNKLLPDD